MIKYVYIVNLILLPAYHKIYNSNSTYSNGHRNIINNNNNNHLSLSSTMSDDEEEYLEMLEWRDLKARWKRDIGLDDFDVGLVCSYVCTEVNLKACMFH